MNKIVNAKLINNIPVCSKCGGELAATTKDYNLVKVNGKKYTQFIRRCLKCNTLNEYYSEMILGDNTRYIFNEDNVDEVKEDQEDIQKDITNEL